MWYTQCKIAFSWRTGRRVHGVIHNPHFYEFQRQGGGAVVNAPNAQICGNSDHAQWRDRMRAIFGENTQGGTYTIIRGYGANRRRVCGPIEQHKKGVFEYLLDQYQKSDTLNHSIICIGKEEIVLNVIMIYMIIMLMGFERQIKLTSFFKGMERFHRGAIHFMDKN